MAQLKEAFPSPLSVDFDLLPPPFKDISNLIAVHGRWMLEDSDVDRMRFCWSMVLDYEVETI